ncbi:anhydro-N-acetylmuramic acid kinase [Bosea lupini]|uniref:Anhydro-N-acetylmuramic acid kinase n=1 Tax=Bosea lupini TaxID=1036779 RepID=A0A1H7QTT0_9HYPH|nr:anhydro-N-acetylmuramic acid kinase [Bosea lupini]SEL51332.1 anhydro-N-acetylmuramic acid kinase [Bosea lupini]
MQAWAIGLMTGTVLDGNIDIAAIRTDGTVVAEFGPWRLSPYRQEVRDLLAEAVQAALAWRFEGPEPAIFAEAERALTLAQGEAVAEFLASEGIASSEVAAIGFHGQTVLHRAPTRERKGDTRQLGDGALMARQLGIDVVYDFRTADVRAGGQGAPLVASYHAALMASIGAGQETAVLNLGGVGNLSAFADAERVLAFDTGPGNAPLNDWIKRHGKGEMDRDGAFSLAGTVDEARLALLLEHRYLFAPYPKSLDRYDFTAAMADGLTFENGAATLTAFTAGAVGRGLDLLPVRPRRLIVCGGGRRNPAIMAALNARTGTQAVPAEAVGWRGDAIEAECFAFLAMRRKAGLPISFPLTTGVSEPMTGGRIARAGSGPD